MWRKHRAFRVLIGPAIGLILLTSVFSAFSLLITQRAVSAAANDYSPAQKAAAWNAGMALSNCSNDAGWDGLQTGADINNGGIFNDSKDITDWKGDPKTVGYITKDDDGTIFCSETSHIVSLFDKLGVDKPLEFLKDLGIYKLNADSTAYEIKLKDDATRAKAIRDAVAKKFGFSYGGTMPKDMQYAALLAAFNKKCKGNRDNQGISVTIVDASGKPTPVNYTLKGGANDVVEVGYSLDADGGNDQKMACPTIVQQMNKYAGDYAKVIAANASDDNPNNDNNNSGGTNGLSEDNPTCETSGNPMTWIMCPIFNGVADFSDWMFRNMVEPLLRVSPVSTDPADGSFQVWSSFRLYGNIFLVISMLVIVFGQAIGGGLIDAYTAKKVMPRILIAAILVNLSIYIVALLVDITNIVGAGIGQLMTAPFGDAGQFKFSPSAATGAGVGIITLGGGSIAAFLTGVLFIGSAGIGAAASFLALFVLMPAVLGIVGAFLTLVIRQGIILTLILVSPVAFAMYCLPNTEKFFKKWWEYLTKALLVYPIIIVMFAIADILAVTIQKANGFGNGPLLTQVPANTLAALVAFVAMFLPLVLIPWAFKLAGGLIGSVVGVLQGQQSKLAEAIKGNPNDPNSARRRASDRFRSARLQGKGQTVKTLNAAEQRIGQTQKLDADGKPMFDAEGKPVMVPVPLTRGQRVRRGVYSRGARALYRGNTLERQISELNAQGADYVQKIQATGPDDTIRNIWAVEGTGDMAGRYFDYITGEERPTAAVKAARAGINTVGALQEALVYEMGKVADDATYSEKLLPRFGQLAQEMGLSDYSTQGIWKGATFKDKGRRLESKHRKIYKDENGVWKMGGTDHIAMAKEAGSKVRSYAMGDQAGSFFGTAMEEMDALATVGSGDASVVDSGALADDSEQLEALQYWYHGLKNLESPSPYGAGGDESGAPPSGGGAGAPRRTDYDDPSTVLLSIGGAGVPTRVAQEAVAKITKMAEADPRIKNIPRSAGVTVNTES